VNALEWISFDFGATLLEWLEADAPATYRAVLDADRRSVARTGWGNAVAAPYHHVILPLATRRDKVTEVRWGIADFRRRFGREPDGFWLPETAVDEETLDVVAAAGIRFTILAPHQVKTVPAGGLPGRFRTASGRDIALFVYDGPLSHDIAFGRLLDDAFAWAQRMLGARDRSGAAPALVSMASDGESYGHHHKFGEMALARFLDVMGRRPDARVTNYAAVLAEHPAVEAVELIAPSAWSCAHGVERWRSDCGCRMAHDQPTNQRWRAPLRDAIGWLTSACHEIYDTDAPRYLRDPAAALAGYGAAIGAGAEAVRQYGGTVAKGNVTEEQLVRATELLEMERGALRTLTSCAWFFDDISGIETLQVLRYAAWVIELAGPDAVFLEEGFTRRLALAESNVRTLGNGRDIYLHRARPHLPPPVRVAAGLVAARAFAPEAAGSPCWLLEGPDDALVLTNRRTGRRYHLEAELEQNGLELLVTMRSTLLDAPVALSLGDLPDRQQRAVAAVLRGEALERLLDGEERLALARGEELRPLIRHALSRRIRALTSDPADPARRDVHDLLVILEQLGQAVPFEVQTVFYRLWHDHASDDAGLAELARRLGFVTGPGGP